MSTPMPMIVPVVTSPPRCPGCQKVENVKRVCAHCGYEYTEEGGVLKEVLIIGGIVVIAILFVSWLTFTCFDWFDGTPLREVLHEQWEWVKGLEF